MPVTFIPYRFAAGAPIPQPGEIYIKEIAADGSNRFQVLRCTGTGLDHFVAKFDNQRQAAVFGCKLADAEAELAEQIAHGTVEQALFAWFKVAWVEHQAAELVPLLFEYLCEQFGCDEDELRDAIDDLEEVGLIEAEGISARLSARGVMVCNDANELTVALAEIDPE